MKKLLLLSILLIVGCEETLEPQDCAGFHGGPRIEDDCGICHSPSIQPGDNLWNATCLDCLGELNGMATFDLCGVCGGDGIPDDKCDCDDNVLDCAEECGGYAILDECGTCDTDTTNDCVQDCTGEWGGDVILDCEGVCSGDKLLDNCDICDSDITNDCNMDECGVWGGENSCFTTIGIPTLASNNMTVTLNELTITEKTGSYEYYISYTLENNTADQEIDEGSFKMYYQNESGGKPQYGGFNSLFPGDTKNRTYTFEELKTTLFGILSYHDDQFFADDPPI